MKITITVVLEIDRDAWELAYGTQPSAADLREDVRSYVLDAMQGSAAAMEGGIRSAQLK